MKRVPEEGGKMPREVWPIVAAHWSRPSYYAGMQTPMWKQSQKRSEMEDADPNSRDPVLLLDAGKSNPSPDRVSCYPNRGHCAAGNASASAHWIHLDEPGLVADFDERDVTGCTPRGGAQNIRLRCTIAARNRATEGGRHRRLSPLP